MHSLQIAGMAKKFQCCKEKAKQKNDVNEGKLSNLCCASFKIMQYNK